MKISDVLRSLADQVDQHEMQSAAAEPDSDENQADQTGVFVSPLQQKLELLKKSVGVDNIYDNPDEEPPTENHDELDQIKKLSGLPIAVHQADDASDPM